MKINKKLVPIKLHYFLRNAATASLSLFLPLIIYKKGISPQGIGLLWTMFPFIALVTNSAAGGIADALKIHKAMFISALVLLNVGFTAIYFLPQTKKMDNIYPSNVSSSIEDPSMLDYPVLEQNPMSLGHIVSQWTFWIAFFCILIQHVGLNASIVFTDVVCFKILGKDHQKYGEQRMWGTIGMGSSSIIIGALVDWYSAGQGSIDYLPAFTICFIFMMIDIIVVSRMPIPSKKEDSLDLKALGQTLKSFKSIIFLLTIVVYGFTLGINWTFRLMLVEDAALQYDANFSSLKLLQGTLMFVETFGGELPFLFLSGSIIDRLGPEAVFSMCLVSISVRFSLYFLLPNPWMYIPVEILNGPAYGLIHANIVAYGTKIVDPGALATIHAVIRACISLGQASGGLIGGTFYHKFGGRKTFLFSSLIVGGYVIFYALCQSIYKVRKPSSREKEEVILIGKSPAPIDRRFSQIIHINVQEKTNLT